MDNWKPSKVLEALLILVKAVALVRQALPGETLPTAVGHLTRTISMEVEHLDGVPQGEHRIPMQMPVHPPGPRLLKPPIHTPIVAKRLHGMPTLGHPTLTQMMVAKHLAGILAHERLIRMQRVLVAKHLLGKLGLEHLTLPKVSVGPLHPQARLALVGGEHQPTKAHREETAPILLLRLVVGVRQEVIINHQDLDGMPTMADGYVLLDFQSQS